MVEGSGQDACGKALLRPLLALANLEMRYRLTAEQHTALSASLPALPACPSIYACIVALVPFILMMQAPGIFNVLLMTHTLFRAGSVRLCTRCAALRPQCCANLQPIAAPTTGG